MKFKELFDKEILTESQQLRKGLKVFYEIDLDLYKPEVEPAVQNMQLATNPTPTELPAQNPEVYPTPETNTQLTPEVTPEISGEPSIPNDENGMPQLSVNTEDFLKEDEVVVNNENVIVRKFKGEFNVSDTEMDNIQTLDDVIEILSDYKKNGTNILDEFSTEIIQLCTQQNFNEIKNKLDKKSKIFVEIGYGFKKDDSVEVRFNKRKNSNTLTSTMLVDNEIVSAKFSLDKVNTKIAEYRNYAANKK